MISSPANTFLNGSSIVIVATVPSPSIFLASSAFTVALASLFLATTTVALSIAFVPSPSIVTVTSSPDNPLPNTGILIFPFATVLLRVTCNDLSPVTSIFFDFSR